jgi:hypothetical protein
MKLTMGIVMFLLIGAFFIISNNNLHMLEQGSLSSFISIYVSWVGEIFDNGAQLSGYVVKLDWMPKTG